MKEIDRYMTINEAAERFNIPVDTIKNRLKPSIKSFNLQLEEMIERGLIKYYLKKDGKRKEWIISTKAMEVWFSKKEEMSMYYANEEHKRNYLRLLTERGTKHGEDPEYEAAFYITAYPEIHKCFDWNEFKTEYSPLGSLLNKERQQGVSTAPLTSSTLPLVQAGQSLFNGYKVDLSDLALYNEELFNVFMQACKIRGRI